MSISSQNRKEHGDGFTAETQRAQSAIFLPPYTKVWNAVGFDGGKKVQGRKRHILVDTMGLLIGVVVTAANGSDQQGAKQVCQDAHPRCPRMQYAAADQAYGGTLISWVKEHGGWTLEVIKRLEGQQGFHVLPKRWIVERSLSWLTRNCQLSKEYDHDSCSSEGWMYLASIRVMLRYRLVRAQLGTLVVGKMLLVVLLTITGHASTVHVAGWETYHPTRVAILVRPPYSYATDLGNSLKSFGDRYALYPWLMLAGICERVVCTNASNCG